MGGRDPGLEKCLFKFFGLFQVANLERFRLKVTGVFVRRLTLVEDFEDVAALDGDLEVFADLLFMIIVVLSDRVAYPLHAGPLLLAADLSDCIQEPGGPRVGGLDLPHRRHLEGGGLRTSPPKPPPASFHLVHRLASHHLTSCH